jgi:Tfp pilus assembly protein PilO
MNPLLNVLKKLPFGLLAFGVLGWYGYQYFTFMNSAESPLGIKKAEIESLKTENVKLKQKAQDAENFRLTLDSRRNQVRETLAKLGSMKSTISDAVDNVEFISTVLTEAKKVGLSVLSFDRDTARKQEYYTEHVYRLNFKGVYVQLLVFFERLANVQRVIRVDNFKLKPISGTSARYVELEGVVEIKTYNYELSNIDKEASAAAAGAAKTAHATAPTANVVSPSASAVNPSGGATAPVTPKGGAQ